MKINCRELFLKDIPDEAAYYLVDFFYSLALIFDCLHLVQAMRHEKDLIDGTVKQKHKPGVKT